MVLGFSVEVIVMNYGKNFAEGAPDKVKNDDKVIEAYLGRSNATA